MILALSLKGIGEMNKKNTDYAWVKVCFISYCVSVVVFSWFSGEFDSQFIFLVFIMLSNVFIISLCMFLVRRLQHLESNIEQVKAQSKL